MPTVDDSAIAIADSYAAALLEICEQRGTSDEVLSGLTGLVGGMKSDDNLRQLMTSAAIDDEVRGKVMEKTFRGRMSDLLVNTLLVMNAKGRSSLVEAVHERFRLALARLRGEVDVRVTTAFPLSKHLRRRLVEVLAEVTGKKPVLSEELDESVLGGLVVQVGDRKLDCSVARQLQRLRESFGNRASREIHAGTQYFNGAEE